MTNLDEYKTTDQLEKENLALKREVKAALLTIDRLLKDANTQREKISHLESLISQAVPVVKKENQKLTVTVAADEEIAVLQLERLRQAAQSRTLTLEEIRAYDLLVKNKRLVLDESTINLGKNQYRDVADTDLLKIAATQVKDFDDPDAK